MVTKSLFATVTAVIFHSSYAWQEKRLLNTTHVSQAEATGEKLVINTTQATYQVYSGVD